MFSWLFIEFFLIVLNIVYNRPNLSSAQQSESSNLLQHNTVVQNETLAYQSSSDQIVFNTSTPAPQSKHVEFNRTAYVLRVKSMRSLRQLQQITCTHLCTRETPGISCTTLECNYCSCIWPDCVVYGLCCPDAAHDLNETVSLYADQSSGGLDHVNDGTTRRENIKNESINYEHLVHPKLVCENNTYQPFVYIQSCSPLYHTDEMTRRLCEDDDALDELSVENVCRVVDEDTHAIYRNRFCARCNGVTRLLNFEIEVKCESFMSLYTATEEEDVLKLVAKKDSNCFLFQVVPYGINTIRCRQGQFDSKVVDTCDPSVSFDPDIEQACNEPNGPVYMRFYKTTETFYKSLFCALCNKVSIIEHRICPPGPAVRPWFSNLPLSLLFSNERRSFNTFAAQAPLHDTCLNVEVLSFANECLSVKCAPGKTLTNGTCTTVFQGINFLGYSIQLWAIPVLSSNEAISGLVGVNDSSVLAETLAFRISALIEKLSHNFNIDIITMTPNTTSVTDNAMLKPRFSLFVDCRLVSDLFWRRDHVERTLVETFINDPIHIKLDKTRRATFRSYIVPGTFNIVEHCKRLDHNFTCTSLAEHKKYLRYRMSGTPQKEYSFLRVNKLLTCSHVSLNKSHYAIQADDNGLPGGVTVVIDVSVAQLVLSDISDLNMLEIDSNGNLNICLELLKSKTTEMRKVGSEFQVESDVGSTTVTQYILTVGLMLTSIICLLFTVITYCRFKMLQNAAGRNNILLCTSLIAAQFVLLVATHVSGPNVWCTAVAMATHFLWLWMFSWTFICCLHMFKVFTAKTRSVVLSAQALTRQTVKKIVGSLSFPTTVVTTIVVTSIIKTNGHQTGYGENTCFLNSHTLINVGVVGPLALILSSNIICFVITVYKIHTVKMKQTSAAMKREDKMNLYVYIKLSSMTGAFWAMAIISERWDNDILRFLSIILNGLQGVFIFLSFICNKRVLRLYLPRLGHEDTLSGAS